MISLQKLLKLGDPRLYNKSESIRKEEVLTCMDSIQDLHQIILDFRKKYGAGRAVAAPQIGVPKRIICWNTKEPVTMLNPLLSVFSEEKMEVWDDCMCFPGLLVKVLRHQSCSLEFFDLNWQKHQWKLSGDESELIQHEVDHLDGILATQRAMDTRSFKLTNLKLLR